MAGFSHIFAAKICIRECGYMDIDVLLIIMQMPETVYAEKTCNP